MSFFLESQLLYLGGSDLLHIPSFTVPSKCFVPSNTNSNQVSFGAVVLLLDEKIVLCGGVQAIVEVSIIN